MIRLLLHTSQETLPARFTVPSYDVILELDFSPACWHSILPALVQKCDYCPVYNLQEQCIFGLCLDTVLRPHRLFYPVYSEVFCNDVVFNDGCVKELEQPSSSFFPLLVCLSLWEASSCETRGTCPLSSISVLKCMSWVFPC